MSAELEIIKRRAYSIKEGRAKTNVLESIGVLIKYNEKINTSRFTLDTKTGNWKEITEVSRNITFFNEKTGSSYNATRRFIGKEKILEQIEGSG